MSYTLPPPPGRGLLFIGVVFPLIVVAVELLTALCAGAFFDPLPTWGHVLLVLAVPGVNLLLWRAARRDDGSGSPHLLVLGGAAIAVSAAYALVFLPMLPIALIGILFFGLGLLPYAPVLALVATAKLMARVAEAEERRWRRAFAGAGAGLVALMIADLPAAATQLAVTWAARDEAAAQRGAALMRAVGDEKMLLRLCYGEVGRAAGPLSFIVTTLLPGTFADGRTAPSGPARQLYFRTTGLAFNAAQPPRARGGLFDFESDDDQGGTAVAGRARGLDLTESRLDGSIAAADNLAYLEWTAVFTNRSVMQREARLTLALPEGAVASRATLWVNGEAREASVAGRGAARAAYERVVTASRDPLLVTTQGGGRLLVQAFPVQPESSLKLRIGITAPLAIDSGGRRSLALPGIADRNFDVPQSLRHRMWIEADTAIAADRRFAIASLRSGTMQARGEVPDEALRAGRPSILVAAIRAASRRTAIVPAQDKEPAFSVMQEIASVRGAAPHGLAIILDGSAANKKAAEALRQGLAALPAGLPVGLHIASGAGRSVPSAPWAPAQRLRFEQAIADTRFQGGHDNLPAIADALDRGGDARSVLLWIHGPQPAEFAGSRSRLEQILERRASLPRLVRYQPVAGPAFTVEGERWFDTAQEAAPSGDARADLAALLAQLAGGARWEVRRTAGNAASSPAASLHIARLWAAERLSGAGEAQGTERAQAIALAHRLNIVTPVSGAVVLETDRNYGENGLPVPGASDVPTVPEPGTWALLAIVAGLFLWLYRRRRQSPAFA
jgi:hypothetical protein